MRTLKIFAALAILAALFGCTQKSPLSPDRPVRNLVTEDSCSITGFVIFKSDSGDTDFSGAEVILVKSGRIVYTEKNGFFKFEGLQPDTYSVKIRKYSYEPQLVSNIYAAKGSNVFLSSVTLLPDKTLPAPPLNLAASLYKGKVTLTWDDPAADEDITYLIFRSTFVLTNLTGVSTDILNEKLIASDIRKGLGNYVVSAANDSQTYLYTLASMDYSGNLCDIPPYAAVFESSDTLAGDYMPPAVPLSVRAAADDRLITIQIEQPYDYDIYYSLLYKMEADADTAALTIGDILDSIQYTPGQRLYSSSFYKTSYDSGGIIYAVQNFDERSYSAIAFDLYLYQYYYYGGEKKISSWNTINKSNLVLSDTLTLSVTEGPLVPPSKVFLSLYNKSPQVSLEWYAPVIDGIPPGYLEYNIYRSTSALDGYVKLDSGPIQQVAGHYSFIDEGVSYASRNYYYKLSAINIVKETESSLSQAFGFSIPDYPVPPEKPVLTSLEYTGGYVVLLFKAPLSEGAAFYNIYRRASGENDYTRIQDKVYPNQYDNYLYYYFDYNVPQKGRQYQYRISVSDLSGLESLLSDSMEIFIPADLSLIEPYNNASVTVPTPSFSWEAVPGALSYTIEVFPGAPSYSPSYAPTGGLPPQLDGWVQRCIKTASISFGERVDALPEIEPTDQTLVRGRRYYWRVTAYDTDNVTILNSAGAEAHVIGRTPLEWSFTYDLP